MEKVAESVQPVIRVKARKFDGRINREWNCKLIAREDSRLTLFGIFDQEVNHPDIGVIRRGTISYEFYWLDRWYNIFRFHEPDGGFKCFYCNINQPPVFENGVLEYTDLDVDIIVDAEFNFRLLDINEFTANSIKLNYPPELIEKVRQTISELIQMIETRSFPF